MYFFNWELSITDFVERIATVEFESLDASFNGGRTRIIFGLVFKKFSSNKEGVFDPITIRSGLKFFCNPKMEF